MPQTGRVFMGRKKRKQDEIPEEDWEDGDMVEEG